MANPADANRFISGPALLARRGRPVHELGQLEGELQSELHYPWVARKRIYLAKCCRARGVGSRKAELRRVAQVEDFPSKVEAALLPESERPRQRKVHVGQSWSDQNIPAGVTRPSGLGNDERRSIEPMVD